MTQLIPLHSQTIDGNAVETVNARELHEFLESKRQFADWIKNRIEQYDFVENQDFVCVSQKNEAEKSMTYDNWQGRIERYEFVENQDFVCVPQNWGTQRAVRLCGE